MDTLEFLLERYGWARGRGAVSGQWDDPLRPGQYCRPEVAYGIQRFRCRNLQRWKDGYWPGVFGALKGGRRA